MEILSGRRVKALKTVVYGPEGIGKSTFAAAFPEPLFIDTEDSTKFMDVRRFKKPASWAELMAQVKHTRNTPGLCRTLVIDTADWAELLCVNSICASKQMTGIEDAGYGRGYVYLAEEFGRLLDMLSEVVNQEINVVLTAHAAMRKFEQPDELGAYDRWELKLQKKTAALVKEWSDLLLFANYKTISVAVDKAGTKHKAQGGKRVMYTTHHPCWDAKNRQGVPDEMPFDFRAIEPYLFPRSKAEAPTQPPAASPPARPTPQPAPQPDDAPIVDPGSTKPDEPPAQKKQETPPPPPAASEVYIPAVLDPLLKSADVTEEEVRAVVAAKGYYTKETPWKVMEESGFVEGWLLPFWDRVVEVIRNNPNRLPF